MKLRCRLGWHKWGFWHYWLREIATERTEGMMIKRSIIARKRGCSECGTTKVELGDREE